MALCFDSFVFYICANSGIQVMQIHVQSDNFSMPLGFYMAQMNVTQILPTMALV